MSCSMFGISAVQCVLFLSSPVGLASIAGRQGACSPCSRATQVGGKPDFVVDHRVASSASKSEVKGWTKGWTRGWGQPIGARWGQRFCSAAVYILATRRIIPVEGPCRETAHQSARNFALIKSVGFLPLASSRDWPIMTLFLLGYEKNC